MASLPERAPQAGSLDRLAQAPAACALLAYSACAAYGSLRLPHVGAWTLQLGAAILVAAALSLFLRQLWSLLFALLFFSLTALGYGRARQRDPSLRAPLVMNPQGMEEHKAAGLKRLALLRLRGLGRQAACLSDRVIATDESTRDEVPRHLGVDPARVVVLPNGIDPEELQSATPSDSDRVLREALPAAGASFPLFLSVGRIEAYKGFDDALLALDRLHRADELPPRWAWVVVGEGRDRERLTRRVMARELLARSRGARGIASHVHWAGQVDEGLLHALYACADVFVHTTRYEGSSLVTLEAMAHGLPVVATRAGGIPDKVTDGENGRLVDPGDVEGLARGLSELAQDAALREAMGSRGRKRALEGFGWPALAARTVALYEELLGSRRG